MTRRLILVCLLPLVLLACSQTAPARDSSTPTVTSAEPEPTTAGSRPNPAPPESSPTPPGPETSGALEVPTAEATEAPITPFFPPEATPTQPAPGQADDLAGFQERFAQAVLALRDLPAYSYTVTDASVGLQLTGMVAGPEDRSWTVSEMGFPEHVLARWVLKDGLSYTDIDGAWTRIAEAPFTVGAPLSFAGGPTGMQLTGWESVEGISQSRVTVGGQPAIRYEVPRRSESGSTDLGPANVDTVAIAEDGGYLLEYDGPTSVIEPAPRLRIEVRPLAATPKIETPKVGSPAFKGSPPPWRARLIAERALASLRSYEFNSRTPAYGPVREMRGEVAEEQGRVVASVVIGEEWGEQSGAAPKRFEMIYVGPRVWARVGKARWQQIHPLPAPDVPGSTEVTMAITRLPGRPGLASFFTDVSGPFNAERYMGMGAGAGVSALREGELVGVERVNGVRAWHYRGRTLEQEALSRDLWVATKGLYLVRITGGADGQLDIKKVDKPLQISPPNR